MFKIKTMNKISKVGLGKLDPARFEIGDNVENEDAILVRSACRTIPSPPPSGPSPGRARG